MSTFTNFSSCIILNVVKNLSYHTFEILDFSPFDIYAKANASGVDLKVRKVQDDKKLLSELDCKISENSRYDENNMGLLMRLSKES